MIELNQNIKPDPEVVVTELEDGKEAVLLHLGTKSYFTLNETGLIIWQKLDNGVAPGEVCKQLANEFDISSEKAKESVLDLIQELINEKLVTVINE